MQAFCPEIILSCNAVPPTFIRLVSRSMLQGSARLLSALVWCPRFKSVMFHSRVTLPPPSSLPAPQPNMEGMCQRQADTHCSEQQNISSTMALFYCHI